MRRSSSCSILAVSLLFTPIFFGFTSNQSIASVTVYSRDPGSIDIGLRANVIDNVTVGTAIPEPGTLVLLLLASAGVCFSARPGRVVGAEKL